MNFESIIWFILHYILPYGIAFAILFWLIEFSFRAWIKANLDIAWNKVITWAVVIGLLAVIWAFWHWTVHPWLLKQTIWVMIASRINAVWQMLMQSPIMQTIHQKYLLISHWINAKIGDYRWYYWQAFVVTFLFGAIIDSIALVWRVSFPRTANVIVPAYLTFPRIFLYLVGRQTPIEDFILAGKLRAKIKENLNDSYEAAVQGYQDNGQPFKDGAGGTAATQTKKATAVAMRRTKIKVKTTANGIREAKILIRQSRETETDRSIENALKGLGDRISGNSIFFPSDPTYNSKLKGYTFNSSVSYEADEQLGAWKDIFTNPFNPDNSTSRGGKGYLISYFEKIGSIFNYIGHLTPYAIYKRFVKLSEYRYAIDESAEVANFKVQQNLDLSVIPPAIDPKTKNDVKTQRTIAMRKAKARIPDVTMALNAVKINGQFKKVEVGGNNAIYEYVLPQDPNLPDNFDRIQKQIANYLRIKATPIITLSAGILKLSIDNGVNVPASFSDMILARKKGVPTLISGMLGVDELGNPIYFELGDSNPHAILFGKTGTGKTVTIMTIVYSVMAAVDPSQVKMVFIDGKGNSFEFMRNDKGHPNPYVYAQPADASGDIEYARALIKHLENEVRRRIAIFKENSVQKLAEFNKKFPDQKMPELLVIVDEFSAIMDKDNDLNPSEMSKLGTADRFEYLAKMARSTGIRLLFANQTARKDKIRGNITANITGRVSLGLSEAIESDIALPDTGIKAHFISQPGEFYSIMNGVSNFEHGNSPYLSEDTMNALNDSLTKKFGRNEYVISREEILAEMNTTVSDGDGSNVDVIDTEDVDIPDPKPTPDWTLDRLKALDKKYWFYLYNHREELLVNNTNKDMPKFDKPEDDSEDKKQDIGEDKDKSKGENTFKLRRKSNLPYNSFKKELEEWYKAQKSAENVDAHRSTGSIVATSRDKVKDVTEGNDKGQI